MSIATQITRLNNNIEAMKNTKQQIKDAVNNDFDIIANEQIENYDTLIENGLELYKQYIPPVETNQATEIQVTDAMKCNSNKLEIFGNTEQTQYSGKNLLNIADTQYTWNDISVEISNGIITLNGTPSVNSTNKNFASYTATEDGIYTLLPFKSSTNNNIRLLYSINGGSQQNSDSTPNINLTTGDVLSINLRVSTTDSISSFVLKPMLYKGSTATDYEPYVGGQPSPSPDYPQDIHVVTGNNTIGVQGINIFDGILENGTVDYSTGVNAISTTGIVRSKNYIPISSSFTIITKTPFSSSHTIGCRYYDKDYNYIGRGSINLTNYATATPNNSLDNTKTVAYMRFIDSSANEDITEEFCIRTDSSTDYVPYYHADYPINLGSMELCKIGNYQDYLYKENGNWYKYKNIHHSTFRGLSNWTYQSSNKRFIVTLSNTPKNQGKAFSNFYINGETIGNNNYFSLASGSGYSQLLIHDERFTTKEDFNAWIENNNIEVYYILNTPTTTQITDETLIAQLDSIYEHLQLVKGTNNITVTASDLAPYMKLSYKNYELTSNE